MPDRCSRCGWPYGFHVCTDTSKPLPPAPPKDARARKASDPDKQREYARAYAARKRAANPTPPRFCVGGCGTQVARKGWHCKECQKKRERARGAARRAKER